MQLPSLQLCSGLVYNKMIECKDFSAFYVNKKEQFTALSKLNFSVDRGELFVVVGESGSGKTTLLKSILRMIPYVDGEMLVDGIPIDDLDIKTCNFAFVDQEVTLYPQKTVYENIAFPLLMNRTPYEEIDRRVKEIADIMDIRWLLSRKPKQLSGGQHQRVGLARALIKKPDLVLLDEPFSNLDPEIRRQMRQLLRQVHQQYHTTIVFVTHDLGEAFSLADRIMVLNNGKIEVIGSPTELTENPRSELLEVYLNP